MVKAKRIKWFWIGQNQAGNLDHSLPPKVRDHDRGVGRKSRRTRVEQFLLVKTEYCAHDVTETHEPPARAEKPLTIVSKCGLW